MTAGRNSGKEAMRAALMQASLDLMNLSAFLRLEGKTEIADIGLRMSEAARSAAAEPEAKWDLTPCMRCGGERWVTCDIKGCSESHPCAVCNEGGTS